jgi:hypothetical protein
MPGFMPLRDRGGEEVLDQRQRMATICSRLVGAQDQRRQQADHALGGDADHQARPRRRPAEQRRARPVELDADHEALAAHLDDAGDAGELLSSPSFSTLPTAAAFSSSCSLP